MASRVPQPPTSAPPAAVPDGARHGFRVGRHRAADHSSTFAFSVRLGVAITLTFALLGLTGYVMIGDQLQRRMLDNYAVEHRGDARAFSQADRRTRTVAGERREIGEL